MQTARQIRNDEADALLASLSTEQLHEGLKRGREKLAFLAADDVVEDAEIESRIGHPGLHPSRSYEAWTQNYSDTMRAHLNSAIRDTEAELLRRGEVI